MVFLPPCWVPDISPRIPAWVTVGDFVLDGRRNGASVQPPLVDASAGRTCTTDEFSENVDILAAALQQELGWSRDDEKLAEANIDFLIVCWAPTTSVPEIVSHMEKAQCKALVVCEELLPVCKQIFERLPKLPEKIYSMTKSASLREALNVKIKSLAQLLTEGQVLQKLPNRWIYKGDTFNEIAYLCSTSGTAGRQSLAKITHANVISNILQAAVFEAEVKADTPPIEVALGVLPPSHGFGLVSVHLEVFRGNTAVLHGSFNMQLMLKSIQDHHIERLYLIMVAALANNPILFQLFDLSSIREIVMGAAACSDSLSKKMYSLQPTCKILAGYGLTECVSPVTLTPRSDVTPGSSGLLLPSVRARLIGAEGQEITEHEVPGELHLQSPTQIPGYLGESEEEDAKFLVNGWLPTGDIGFFQKGSNGNEHLFLVDRVKDMIKAKGLQVSTSTIENVLRLHPAVNDAAIVGVEDEMAGERPLAFVVTTNQDITDQQHKSLLLELDQYVQNQLDESHWLRKRTFLVEELPKTAAGKASKKKLRDAVKRYNLKAIEPSVSLKIEF
ncbi:acetyl-CoA synthetase-like protein [Trichoderma evansii]